MEEVKQTSRSPVVIFFIIMAALSGESSEIKV